MNKLLRFQFSSLVIMNLSALGQGTFQNLGFEENNLSAIPPGQTTIVPFSDAFPGWVGYFNGTNPVATAVYNGVSLGAPLISLIGRSTQYYSNSVISGEFTAVLS